MGYETPRQTESGPAMPADQAVHAETPVEPRDPSHQKDLYEGGECAPQCCDLSQCRHQRGLRRIGGPPSVLDPQPGDQTNVGSQNQEQCPRSDVTFVSLRSATTALFRYGRDLTDLVRSVGKGGTHELDVVKAGIFTVKVAPPPGVSERSICPWWLCTMAATMASPSPVPPLERDRDTS